VERILSMVDGIESLLVVVHVYSALIGVILLVDASEGPMAQTKFVLSRALALNKKAIVVLNKIDRENHRAVQVESEIFDLFCALSSNDSLLEYPLLYASARQGIVC